MTRLMRPVITKTTSQDSDSDISGSIDTPRLLLIWAEAPWDTAVFGFPVLQIHRLELLDQLAVADMAAFEKTRDMHGAGLVSCRLSHERLRESFFLETHGFRFIEMVYQPEVDNLQNHNFGVASGLDVVFAEASDLPAIQTIAGNAFRNERYHMDPRLDPAFNDQRYCSWVQRSLEHPNQRLYALRDRQRLVAFFVTEMLEDGTCYWHLNAVAPDAQGQGYGRRAWLAMLGQAKIDGAKKVRTCIVARNYRVLNLYASLGFRFPPPLMTFHWMREPNS